MSNLGRLLREGAPYDVLYTIQTLASRHIAAGKPDQAQTLRLAAANSLTSREAYEEAVALLSDWFSSVKDLNEVETESLNRQLRALLDIAARMDPNTKSFRTFLDRLVRWMRDNVSVESELRTALRYRAAVASWRAAAFDEALAHFVRSAAPQEMAEMLIDWSSRGFDRERVLFLTRGVLKCVILEKNGVREKWEGNL